MTDVEEITVVLIRAAMGGRKYKLPTNGTVADLLKVAEAEVEEGGCVMVKEDKVSLETPLTNFAWYFLMPKIRPHPGPVVREVSGG